MPSSESIIIRSNDDHHHEVPLLSSTSEKESPPSSSSSTQENDDNNHNHNRNHHHQNSNNSTAASTTGDNSDKIITSHHHQIEKEDYEKFPTPWATIFCLTLFYFLMSGIENGLGPAVVTTFESEFNMTTTEVVASQSMSEVTKIISSLFIGHFANKAKLLFVCIGGLIWAVGCALLGGVVDSSMIYVSFAIMGIGYSFPSVLSPSILEDYFLGNSIKGRIPYLLGIIYAGATVGVAIGFLIGGFTLESDYWRWDFFVSAALTSVPIAILGKFVLQETCSSHQKIKDEMKRSVMEPDLPLIPTVKTLMANRIFLGMCFCLTMQLAYVNAFIALLPKFIEEGLGQSKSTASFVLAATVPAAVFGTFLGGYLCKRFKLGLRGQLKFCLGTNLLVLPMFLVLASSDHILVIGFLVAAMFFVFMNASPALTLIALSLDDRRQVSYANATVNILMRVFGGVPGPILLGYLIDISDRKFLPPPHSSDTEVASSLSSSTFKEKFLAIGDGVFTFEWAYLSVGLGFGLLTVLGVLVALIGAPDRQYSRFEENDDDEEVNQRRKSGRMMNNNTNNNHGGGGDEYESNMMSYYYGGAHSKNNEGAVVVLFDPTTKETDPESHHHRVVSNVTRHYNNNNTNQQEVIIEVPMIQVTNPSKSPTLTHCSPLLFPSVAAAANKNDETSSSSYSSHNNNNNNNHSKNDWDKISNHSTSSRSNGVGDDRRSNISNMSTASQHALLKPPENNFLSNEEEDYYDDDEEERDYYRNNQHNSQNHQDAKPHQTVAVPSSSNSSDHQHQQTTTTTTPMKDEDWDFLFTTPPSPSSAKKETHQQQAAKSSPSPSSSLNSSPPPNRSSSTSSYHHHHNNSAAAITSNPMMPTRPEYSTSPPMNTANSFGQHQKNGLPDDDYDDFL